MIERGLSAGLLVFGVLQFLVYPHLAYLHARLAPDSRRAEIRNLAADSVMLGAWAAQLHFALWPSCGLFAAVCLNNAATGGLRRFGCGAAVFVAAAAAWGAVLGYPFEPHTGPLVSGLCLAGIVGYTSWIGMILHHQNKHLIRTRDALRSNEAQLRFIAEHAGDFVAVLDANARFVYASASHRAHFAAEAVSEGGDWLALVHPDDRERARNFLRYMTRSRASERIQLRMLPTHGPSRILECDGNPARDNRSQGETLILVCHDVTARVRAEIDLLLAAHAFDGLADGVLISDGSGRVEYVNKAYADLTGYAPGEVVGRSVNDLRSTLQSEQLFEEIRRGIGRTGSWHGRVMQPHKDGKPVSVWASVSAVVGKNGVATHYVWVISSESRERSAARSA
jgi:PAS domain S-box-containing protein